MSIDTTALSRAVDLLSDALRFAKEAERAAERGRDDDASHFAALARQSAELAAHDLREAP